MSLALNRHYEEVWKKRVRHYYWGNHTKEEIGRIAHTRKSCSCIRCGNPRKYYNKKTLQELREDLEFLEQLKEICGSTYVAQLAILKIVKP